MSEIEKNSLFMKPSTNLKHLYSRDAFRNVEHRRTLSSNLEQIKANVTHKRTLSGKVEAEEDYSKPVQMSKEASRAKEEQKLSSNLRSKSRGFMRTLNAAISYFESEVEAPSIQLQEIRLNLHQLDQRMQANHRNIERLFKKYVKVKEFLPKSDKSSEVLSSDNLPAKTRELELALAEAHQQLADEKEKNRRLQCRLFSDTSQQSDPLDQSSSFSPNLIDLKSYLQIPSFLPSNYTESSQPVHKSLKSNSVSTQNLASSSGKHVRMNSFQGTRGLY
jgi:hypothetical protein